MPLNGFVSSPWSSLAVHPLDANRLIVTLLASEHVLLAIRGSCHFVPPGTRPFTAHEQWGQYQSRRSRADPDDTVSHDMLLSEKASQAGEGRNSRPLTPM
jgi:hypothetical protein